MRMYLFNSLVLSSVCRSFVWESLENTCANGTFLIVRIEIDDVSLFAIFQLSYQFSKNMTHDFVNM